MNYATHNGTLAQVSRLQEHKQSPDVLLIFSQSTYSRLFQLSVYQLIQQCKADFEAFVKTPIMATCLVVQPGKSPFGL